MRDLWWGVDVREFFRLDRRSAFMRHFFLNIFQDSIQPFGHARCSPEWDCVALMLTVSHPQPASYSWYQFYCSCSAIPVHQAVNFSTSGPTEQEWCRPKKLNPMQLFCDEWWRSRWRCMTSREMSRDGDGCLMDVRDPAEFIIKS